MTFRRNSIILGTGRVSSAVADGEGNISFFVNEGGGIEERQLDTDKNHIRSNAPIVSYADDVARVNGGLLEVRGGRVVFREV
ncbi:MAG: hypothetical protein FWC80_01920 [Firmicutes bacterium]|nr:hypothetical protein [Bacillota bacterium]